MDLSNNNLIKWLKHLLVQVDIYVQFQELKTFGLTNEELEGYIEFYWEGWYGEDKDLGVSRTMWRKDN